MRRWNGSKDAIVACNMLTGSLGFKKITTGGD